MRVRVKLRFNKLTGEVEEFLVDDYGLPLLPEAEHNSEHDRIAAAVGRVLERHPRVTEAPPGAPEPRRESESAAPEAPSSEPERYRQ